MYQAQLQCEQTRFHEMMRPRNMNPTYVSSNVGSSMGSMMRSQSLKQLPRRSMANDLAVSTVVQPKNNIDFQPLKKSDSAALSNQGSASSREQRYNMPNNLATSNLSNYGTNSLGPMRKYISDKEVYQKQQKKYNIVTIQPKEYEDTIKVFPKYHLENSDENYYKKLILENKLTSRKNMGDSRRRFELAMDKKLDLNPESYRFNNDNNTSPHMKAGQPTQVRDMKPFRGKMLNNIDQLAGVL